jgi:hypothetical protein
VDTIFSSPPFACVGCLTLKPGPTGCAKASCLRLLPWHCYRLHFHGQAVSAVVLLCGAWAPLAQEVSAPDLTPGFTCFPCTISRIVDHSFDFLLEGQRRPHLKSLALAQHICFACQHFTQHCNAFMALLIPPLKKMGCFGNLTLTNVSTPCCVCSPQCSACPGAKCTMPILRG